MVSKGMLWEQSYYICYSHDCMICRHLSCCFILLAFSVVMQDDLRGFWLGDSAVAATKLSPCGEAKAWALREAWRELKPDSDHGMYTFIAARVQTKGGDNVSRPAVMKFFK